MINSMEYEKKAEREKKLVALSSVIAAVFITGFKRYCNHN